MAIAYIHVVKHMTELASPTIENKARQDENIMASPSRFLQVSGFKKTKVS